MKKWVIDGFDRKTGEPKALTLKAADERDAIREAGDRGLVVESAREFTSSMGTPVARVEGSDDPIWVKCRLDFPQGHTILTSIAAIAGALVTLGGLSGHPLAAICGLLLILCACVICVCGYLYMIQQRLARAEYYARKAAEPGEKK